MSAELTINDMLARDTQDRIRAILKLGEFDPIPRDLASVIWAKDQYLARVGRPSGVNSGDIALLAAQLYGFPYKPPEEPVASKKKEKSSG